MMEQQSTMQAILAFLRKNNLKSTEDMLKSELQKVEKNETTTTASVGQQDQEVGNVLASYKSDGDPSNYVAAYKWVLNFSQVFIFSLCASEVLKTIQLNHSYFIQINFTY